MKKQYIKHFDQEFRFVSWRAKPFRNKRFRKSSAYKYHHVAAPYFRSFHHVAWNRDIDSMQHDEECKYYNIRPQVDDSRRSDPWGDYEVGRNYGRSWKDYTRYSKQWMGNIR